MAYSDGNSYREILSRCLNNSLLDEVDKREGSVIYNTLAPLAMELAEAYVKMDVLEEQSFFMSANGANLDRRVMDYAIVRRPATYAVRVASFKKKGEGGALVDCDVPSGARFGIPDDTSVTFEYVGKVDELDVVRCEQRGTVGNSYVGTLLPLTPVTDLVEAKITSTQTPGDGEETDDELRARVREFLNHFSYGGNIPDYIEKVGGLQGVGGVKVYPAWQYNGSVLLSVTDSNFDPITDEFKASLKWQIDPDESSGKGIGIAPIGHYVTITTPVKKMVSVGMTVQTEQGTELSAVTESVKAAVEDYIKSVRRRFAQDVDLSIYRARIIEAVLQSVKKVVNVTNVTLDGQMQDIVITDTSTLGGQSLPYLQDVVVS